MSRTTDMPAASTANLGAPSQRTVFLVGEEIAEATEEGYANVVAELGRALKGRSNVLVYLTRRLDAIGSDRTPTFGVRRGFSRMRAVANRKLWAELKQARPDTLVYVSRSSVTLAALLRLRLLRSMACQAKAVMIALQPRNLRWLSCLLARLLWPNLLLVGTRTEFQRASALGATVECIATAVDLDRFRPAEPGEKEALRRKWGLPLDTRVVLHVGHLTLGRNLEALQPLAAQPGLTVVVVASSQRESESTALEQVLRANGIVVIQGFAPKIEEAYRLADCYVFPTTSGDHAIAMPLSVLEAMASNLPVAAMRFGALPERFGNVEGVVLVEESGELSGAVIRLLQGSASTRHLAQAYSWEALAERVVSA